MRGIFEGEIILRYLITSSLLAIEQSNEKNAYIVRIHSESKSLRGIYRAGNLNSLTPWIRRAGAAPLVNSIQLPSRIESARLFPLRKADFKKFLALARKARTAQKMNVVLIPQRRAYQCIAQTNEKEIALTIPRNPIILAKTLRSMQRHFPIEKISIFTDRLKDLMEIQPLKTAVPIKGIRPSSAEMPNSIDSKWSKNVVVLTNVAQNDLPYLQKNLDFWARGVPGFRLKHVFGILTPARIERELLNRENCILAYRGHARYTSKGVVWQLESGDYRVPTQSVSVYFHLACGSPHDLPLKCLPGHDNLITFAPIEDFDDASLFRQFLIQLRTKQRLASALFDIQKTYPQFIHVQL